MIPPDQRQHFYEEMAARAKDGVALNKAVEGYWETQTDSGRIRTQWRGLLNDWQLTLNGQKHYAGVEASLAELTRGHFPDIERAFIRIAETAEHDGIVRGFEAAAAYSKQAEELRDVNKSTFGNIVPWAITSWSLCATVYFSQEIIATKLDIVVPYSANQEKALSVLWLLSYGFWPVFAVVVLAKLASLWVFPNWTGERRRWCDLHLPGFRGYAQHQGLGLLSGLAFMMSSGKSAQDALSALREAANPWLLSYVDDLLVFCKTDNNDLVPALNAVGGQFPNAEMVRRLNEASKSQHFADRAAEILKREIVTTSKAMIQRLHRLLDHCMVATTTVTIVSVVLDVWFQTALDKAVI
jgi:type II secretory pathway component PulF